MSDDSAPDLQELSLGDVEQDPANPSIRYALYRDEGDVPSIMSLVDMELSEPYNWYTYRYFLKDWPHLCFLAYEGQLAVGTIVCKQERHKDKLERGYLAMLSVKPSHRGKGIATHLARLAITRMYKDGCQEVVLETEFDNQAALQFYEKLGFVREKRLHRFYLNAKDAFRLKLMLDLPDNIR